MSNDRTQTTALAIRETSLDSSNKDHGQPSNRELVVADEVYLATRDLITADHPAKVVAILISLVRRLGGQIVPASDTDDDVLPIDISLGESEPLLIRASDPEARTRLAKYIPMVVEDALVLALARNSLSRMSEDASVDPLTGLANRRTLDRTLARVGLGDAVITLDLDNFKAVNDTMGHGMGDAVLKSFASALRKELRANDLGARPGGDEFVIVLRGAADEAATALLVRLQRTWRDTRPCVVGFCAGVAAVRRDGPDAMLAADGALYRAKAVGKDTWFIAEAEDYSE